ncbi:50S ribosomal protein L30 [Candidatus Woesearchaeota archaeon]|jgi:large subunit ribosomal protein L30e|nr:50S ribosomal protein L30 [Candidatus Woesearchaeota archaeon]MBT5397543.1 50S ribosomal protein L30 [Candidatus Woesearchaeota archaeon]MBT5924775.1 50S ribosomal protein L30 [Candidatus Woesearchaeota archaeon]MBT6367884.1 50S ribosomal protein L30 [Candidatus Woesearchaeota archaeon]MBT7763109.1 50S ribosomal protein L30 [Candidatus Woesearchaeota archaeon]
MAKKDVDEQTKEIKKQLQEGKVQVGTESVIKGLKKGTLSKVFVAKNCPENVKSDIQHYVQLGNVELVELTMTNEELGVLCKKNFFVSVLGILGE